MRWKQKESPGHDGFTLNSTRHLKTPLHGGSSVLIVYAEQGTATPQPPTPKSKLQPCVFFYHFVVIVKISNTETSKLVVSINKGNYYQNNEQKKCP